VYYSGIIEVESAELVEPQVVPDASRYCVPHAGTLFGGLASLVVHLDLTLCQDGSELSQNGSQLGVCASIVRAGPQGELPTDGHLTAEVSHHFRASRGAKSVGACIDIDSLDLRAFVAQALNSPSNT